MQDAELALLRARELTSGAEAAASADTAEAEAGKLGESNKHLREQLEALAAGHSRLKRLPRGCRML